MARRYTKRTRESEIFSQYRKQIELAYTLARGFEELREIFQHGKFAKFESGWMHKEINVEVTAGKYRDIPNKDMLLNVIHYLQQVVIDLKESSTGFLKQLVQQPLKYIIDDLHNIHSILEKIKETSGIFAIEELETELANRLSRLYTNIRKIRKWHYGLPLKKLLDYIRRWKDKYKLKEIFIFEDGQITGIKKNLNAVELISGLSAGIEELIGEVEKEMGTEDFKEYDEEELEKGKTVGDALRDLHTSLGRLRVMLKGWGDNYDTILDINQRIISIYDKIPKKTVVELLNIFSKEETETDENGMPKNRGLFKQKESDFPRMIGTWGRKLMMDPNDASQGTTPAQKYEKLLNFFQKYTHKLSEMNEIYTKLLHSGEDYEHAQIKTISSVFDSVVRDFRLVESYYTVLQEEEKAIKKLRRTAS